MPIRRRPRRANRGAKRLDVSDLKAIVKDQRIWSNLGVVIEPEDGEPHFEIVTVDGTIVDVLVEVELVPERIHVTARLAGRGGQGRGLWEVPQVGDEVAVIVPDGEVEFCPIVVATLSGGEIPSELTEDDIIFANNRGRIIIRTSDDFFVDAAGDAILEPDGEVKLGSSSASDKVIRGSTRDTSEQTFLTALAAFATATNVALISIPTFIDPAKAAYAAAATAFTTAVATFQAAATASLSGKTKTI